MSKRELRTLRASITDYTTRDEGDAQYIEGYFTDYEGVYEIAPGMSESIAPGAFDGFEQRDIRALTNHDTTLVLGRNTAGTLELRDDEHGLWGSIRVNPNDQDAVNTYERVKRGDVTQCSIGFDIVKESTETKDDGSIHWTIEDADLWEVSVCTFPAYESTNIEARERDAETIKKRELEAWRQSMLARVKEDAK